MRIQSPDELLVALMIGSGMASFHPSGRRRSGLCVAMGVSMSVNLNSPSSPLSLYASNPYTRYMPLETKGSI